MEALPFGELLRRYRLAAGLSQEALADQAGLSLQAVSKIERGLHRPVLKIEEAQDEASGRTAVGQLIEGMTVRR